MKPRKQSMFGRNKAMWGENTEFRLKQMVQNSSEYKSLKEMRLMISGYKCEVCSKAIGDIDEKGKVIKSFDLHHLNEDSLQMLIEKNNITTIEQIRMNPEFWNIDHVQILCRCCHAKTDSYSLHSDSQKKKFDKQREKFGF